MAGQADRRILCAHLCLSLINMLVSSFHNDCMSHYHQQLASALVMTLWTTFVYPCVEAFIFPSSLISAMDVE